MSFYSSDPTRPVVVLYAQAPEHAGRPRREIVRPLVYHHWRFRLYGGDNVVLPKSSSLHKGTQDVPLSYGSGSADGTLAHDTVSMGPFTVNSQAFGA